MDPVYFEVLLITFKIAGWTTVISVVGGFPVAYYLANANPHDRNTLIIWVLLPFWTSFLVRTFAWMILLGRNGAVNQLLLALGVVDAPASLIFNLTGTLIGMSHAMMPLAVMTMLPVMLTIDGNLSRAAATLGAGRAQIFWRIYVPQCMPGVSAAAMMVFISSLGFFITPALLGGARETMLTQVIITQIQELLNWPAASTLSALLLAASVIVFVAYDRVVGLSSLAGGSTDRSARSTTAWSRAVGGVGRSIVNALGSICAAIGAVIAALLPDRLFRRLGGGASLCLFALVVAFLLAPTLFVIPASFTPGNSVQANPNGFSLRWYETVFASTDWTSAAWNSLIVGLASGFLALVLGTMAAFALAWSRFPGKTAALAVILSPLIVPRIVIAVALFFLYSKLELVGTATGLVIAHAVLAVPYVVITVMAVLATYDRRLDQAAAVMGAGRWQILRRITLPIIKPGLLSAFLFAFATSFDELTVALFLTGGSFSTLPRQMWSDLLLQINPTLAAVATLLLAVMTGLLFLNERIRRSAGRA
ncbi:ABC transporter permease subunit [Terrarubrum flagellatum]|uniref:ABC transporter permease subunit n=1 Tax=Terrirubrum flagellatum TaxID=2895980 RepID=UPI0031456F01